MAAETKHITARIKQTDYKKAVAIAKADRRSFNKIVEFAISEYIENHYDKIVKQKIATNIQK